MLLPSRLTSPGDVRCGKSAHQGSARDLGAGGGHGLVGQKNKPLLHRQRCNIGALTIRIGFWGPLYNKYNKETPRCCKGSFCRQHQHCRHHIKDDLTPTSPQLLGKTLGEPGHLKIPGLGFRGLGVWGLGFRGLGLGFKVSRGTLCHPEFR